MAQKDREGEMIGILKSFAVGVVLGVFGFILGFKSTEVEFDPERIFCSSCAMDIKDLPKLSGDDFQGYSRGEFERYHMTWLHLFGPSSSFGFYRPVRVYREGRHMLIFGFAEDESSARDLVCQEKEYLISRFSGVSDE